MHDLPKIYLAAPLFNEMERGLNARLCELLHPYAQVFLPQRDGELLVELTATGIQPDIAERRVFENDVRAMRQSDLLIAILDGSHIDEGVAFEIGFVNGLGKQCIAYQSDVRRALPTGNNPMISQGITRNFAQMRDLVSWVSRWSARRAKSRLAEAAGAKSRAAHAA